jgi:hypothetical protein
MLPRYIVVYMWFRCARSFVPKEISIGAVIMGWGIAEVAIMINTVAVCGCPSPHGVAALVLSCHIFRCILQRLFSQATGLQFVGTFVASGMLIASK